MKFSSVAFPFYPHTYYNIMNDDDHHYMPPKYSDCIYIPNKSYMEQTWSPASSSLPVEKTNGRIFLLTVGRIASNFTACILKLKL